jgi:citronellyl-CoA synthetase
MNQTTQSDLIGIADVTAKIPKFISKVPHLLSGLKQAYLRTPNTPAGLGIAFEKAVQRNPQGTALLFEDQKFSYQKLNEWANQIGHFYLSLGAQKGDVIAVMVENRPELIATVIALAKIGVTSALVNTSQTGKALTHSINLVKPIAVIAGEECRAAVEEVRQDLELAADRFHWFADQATQVDAGKAPQGWTNLAEKADQFPKFNTPTTHTVQGKDGLFYIYTSGTTGLPKAVIFTHSRWTLAYGTYGHVLDLKADDVMYCTLPLYHATGIVV